MEKVFNNIEEYNPGKERKVLIVFDILIFDMISNKNFFSVVTEVLGVLFIGGSKLNIFLVFTTQLYFQVPRDVRLYTSLS